MSVQWIKLQTSIFENRKIRHLRRLPKGDTIALIYLMLLTIAGRCNAGGAIFFDEDIPYTLPLLSEELGVSEKVLRRALDAFQEMHMITQSPDGSISLCGWDEHQNVDGLDRIREQNRVRKQNQRARQTAEKEDEVESMSRDMSRDANQSVTLCHAPDKEREIEKEEEREKEKNESECVGRSPETHAHAHGVTGHVTSSVTGSVTSHVTNSVTSSVTGSVTPTVTSSVTVPVTTRAQAPHAHTHTAEETLVFPKTTNSFCPPTLEEVSDYCRERGNSVDAARFVDYYVARGWMLGKGAPMRDWRATVRSWEGTQPAMSGGIGGIGGSSGSSGSAGGSAPYRREKRVGEQDYDQRTYTNSDWAMDELMAKYMAKEAERERLEKEKGLQTA